MNARSRRRLVLAAIPVLAVLLGPDASAGPSGDVVAVSADGVHWSSGLVAPLFDPDVRWVPGDRRTASFYVRNGGTTAATLRLQVRATADQLMQTRALHVDARSGAGAWVPLAQDHDSATLRVEPLPVGTHTLVDVRAVFDPRSPNASQARSTQLSFVVRLADAQVDRDQPGGGPLPSTGAPAVTSFALLGAALFGGGIVVLVRRREVRRG